MISSKTINLLMLLIAAATLYLSYRQYKAKSCDCDDPGLKFKGSDELVKGTGEIFYNNRVSPIV